MRKVEVGRAWAQARRLSSGSGFLLNKTPSPSPKGLKIGQSPKASTWARPEPKKIRPDPPLAKGDSEDLESGSY
jgi:hypothetical protein